MSVDLDLPRLLSFDESSGGDVVPLVPVLESSVVLSFEDSSDGEVVPLVSVFYWSVLLSFDKS